MAHDQSTADGNFSRRNFLRVGGLGVLGLSAAEARAGETRSANRPADRRCIFLLMNGGPSHLDTWDPKPQAPREVRGLYRPIATTTPGVFVSETMPRLAQRFDRVTLVRSMCHAAAPLHETSLQLLQTGRLKSRALTPPCLGSVVASLQPQIRGTPAYWVVPQVLAPSNIGFWMGQGAGHLGPAFEPHELSWEAATAQSRASMGGRAKKKTSEVERDLIRYGSHRFGQSCLLARQLIERGARFVTVNMFDHLSRAVTWDCHGVAGSSPATLADYGQTLCPQFDLALSALLDDLEDRGLLDQTLVVATGEFGRTPRINAAGGRDHWSRAWSALLAGAELGRGQVVGRTDASGIEPADAPITPPELAGLILERIGIAPDAMIETVNQQTLAAYPLPAPSAAIAPADPNLVAATEG